MPSHCNGCFVKSTCKVMCEKQSVWMSAGGKAFIKLYVNSVNYRWTPNNNNIALDHIKTIQKIYQVGLNVINVNEEGKIYWPSFKNIMP